MLVVLSFYFFFFSSRRRHTRFKCDWSSDVCSSDLGCIAVRQYNLGFAIYCAERVADRLHHSYFPFIRSTTTSRVRPKARLSDCLGILVTSGVISQASPDGMSPVRESAAHPTQPPPSFSS